jgi:C1A family cysteine protease
MNRLIVAVLCFGVLVSASLSEQQYQTLFSKWMKQHNKSYRHDMVRQRYNTWRANLAFITAHNAAGHSYSLALNEFGDMTLAEFKAVHASGTYKAPAASKMAPPAVDLDLPEVVDWRLEGAVLPVQNEEQCGSCWAFVSTDAMSCLWYQKTKLLVELSTQEVIDCSGAFGCEGCNGGLTSGAYQWVMSNDGICEAAVYPFVGQNQNCGSKNCTNVARITNFVSVPAADEVTLKAAVAQQVVSSACMASTQSFQFYSSGVFNDPTCNPQDIDHGMSIIGYGTTSNGTDYWLLRNMWGPTWGMKGYMYMIRGVDMCGIAESATYPTLD